MSSPSAADFNEQKQPVPFSEAAPAEGENHMHKWKKSTFTGKLNSQ
jgi:hypothetical protein